MQKKAPHSLTVTQKVENHFADFQISPELKKKKDQVDERKTTTNFPQTGSILCSEVKGEG